MAARLQTLWTGEYSLVSSTLKKIPFFLCRSSFLFTFSTVSNDHVFGCYDDIWPCCCWNIKSIKTIHAESLTKPPPEGFGWTDLFMLLASDGRDPSPLNLPPQVCTLFCFLYLHHYSLQRCRWQCLKTYCTVFKKILYKIYKIYARYARQFMHMFLCVLLEIVKLLGVTWETKCTRDTLA